MKKWLPAAKYELGGIPYDELSARMLAEQDPHTFQQWAVGQCKGRSGGKGADRGVDGVIIFQTGRHEYERAIVSVKGGRHVNPGMIRDLARVVDREQATAGVFVCLNAPTREMKAEAFSAGRAQLPGGDRPKIQIVTVAELIAGPDLGMSTALDPIAAADAADDANRRSQRAKKRPKPEDLRRQPELPPMPIAGGRKAAQMPLDLAEPLLSEPQRKRRRT